MRNLTSEVAVLIGNRSIATVVLFLAITFIISPNKTEAQASKPSLEFEQSANGPIDAPLSSPAWTNKHLNKNNSHYAAGSVIPYRVIVTNIPTNCPLKIRLSFLTVKNCRHAMDFPTSYNLIPEEHHQKFPFENYVPVIDPLAGITGNFSGPANIVFPPVPNYVIQGPPADQNLTSQVYTYFLSLYGPQSLSAWNADLSGIEFFGISEQNNSRCPTVQQTCEVSFTATSLPVVFAWGGHMAVDTATLENGTLGLAYTLDFITESGSSGVGGVTKCLTQAQAAAIGGGNNDEFDGGGGEITYSFSSGGKPINPTTVNKNGSADQEVIATQKPSVFPNPNNGNTIVTLPSNLGSFDIRLIDVSGKFIRSWSGYKNSRLELTGLKSGMYILKISSRTSKNSSCLKIIVLN